MVNERNKLHNNKQVYIVKLFANGDFASICGKSNGKAHVHKDKCVNVGKKASACKARVPNHSVLLSNRAAIRKFKRFNERVVPIILKKEKVI